MRFTALTAVTLLIFLSVGPAAVGASFADTLASLESQSVEGFPSGSWIVVKDDKGVERKITVTEKTQGKDGWQVTTRMETVGSDAKPITTTSVYGSIPNASRRSVVKVSDDTIAVGDEKIACKVFELSNGQKEWKSAQVPAGGTVKVVGPQGQPFLTLLEYGTP